MSNNKDNEPIICVGRHTWKLSDLIRDFPPQWTNPNKKAIYEISTPPGTQHEGTITASRWQATWSEATTGRTSALPNLVKIAPSIIPAKGFFAYSDTENDGLTHWYMNFADPCLFGYGEGGLLAQDELQITEHPSLASLARAIGDGSHGPPGLVRKTQESAHVATPVLVKGAPRRCSLDTTNIYGDHFHSATIPQVQRATQPIDPPTISNIVALAAHPPMTGFYTAKQIRSIFQTACTGFRAIVLESENSRAALHTGHWGCGAFGGNKGLMAAIQLLAAGTVGVEAVHFWCGHAELDFTALEHGIKVAYLLDGKEMEDAIQLLESANYEWGIANENYVEFSPPSDCLLAREMKE